MDSNAIYISESWIDTNGMTSMDGSSLKVLIALLRYRDKATGYTEMSINNLCNYLNLSKNTIRKAIRQLSSFGMIKAISGGGQDTSKFIFTAKCLRVFK